MRFHLKHQFIHKKKFIFNCLFPKGNYTPKSRFCQVKFQLQIFALPSPHKCCGGFFVFSELFSLFSPKTPKKSPYKQEQPSSS